MYNKDILLFLINSLLIHIIAGSFQSLLCIISLLGIGRLFWRYQLAQRKLKKLATPLLLALSTVFLVSCSPSSDTPNNITVATQTTQQKNTGSILASESTNTDTDETTISTEINSQPELTETQSSASKQLTVHFIDVGQGDSVLVESEGQYMLVDAGENDQGDTVVTYLHSLGIDTLNYVIGTHPHSDHIGGLDDVINNFKIDNIIMPAKEHTTKTYEDVLAAIESQGLKIIAPLVGTTYQLGSASFEIIAPNKDYGDDLNDWSVGIKIINGNNSFVMCGDAESQSETDISNNSIDISADVLKLGHHGSSTSSSDEFLNKVNPTYAVISCGMGNSYGHPHKETMDKLAARGIQIYRTDEQGTIIASSDGTSITWSTQPSVSGKYGKEKEEETTVSVPETVIVPETVAVQQPEAQRTSQSYVLNTKTKKFHYPTCGSLPTSNRKDTDMSRDEIIGKGYQPCKKCNP